MNDQSSNDRTGRLLGLWWISWFGVIIAFIYIAAMECRREWLEGSPALVFSAVAVTVILTSWAAFFFCDNRTRKRDATVVNLLTTMGMIIAGMTLLGIDYFVAIAPRVN